MKKIALIIDSLDKSFAKDGIRGGGNRVAHYLIKEWSKNPQILLDVFSSKSSVNELENVDKVINLENNVFANRELFFEELQKCISKENYDFVVFNDIFSPFGNLILNCNSLPYRYQNCKSQIWSAFLKFWNRKKISKQKKIFENKNRKFFAVSDIVKNDYVSNFSLSKQNVITSYPGVEIPQVISQKKKNEIFTFGIANSGGANKGAYLLLEALKKLKEQGFEFKLKMIYPKHQKDFFFKALLKLHGLEKNVELQGFQKDLSEFYSSIDCLLLPSFTEAFGLVVTEAAAFKTVSLVSSTSGVSELVQDGINGFCFSMEKNREKNLFEKLKEIITLKKESPEEFDQIGSNAELLSKTYTWKKFADTIAENLR